MSLHPELMAYVEERFGEHLQTPPVLTQDALTLSLGNGVQLSVRYAAADAYSLRWTCEADGHESELGIDTAPTHPELTTTPNHLHLADGRVVADPVTRIDVSPAQNLGTLIDALLNDPLLGSFKR